MCAYVFFFSHIRILRGVINPPMFSLKILKKNRELNFRIERNKSNLVNNTLFRFSDASLAIVPPIITHTAATPQDSPNAAHESRDFRRLQSLTPYTFLPLDRNGSGYSIDSIDCSVVCKIQLS